MLQNGFFRVKSYRPKIPVSRIFTKNTPGAFSVNIPEKYNFVNITYAGAGGGEFYMADQNNNPTWGGIPGWGAVFMQTIVLQNRTVTGVVGGKPTKQVGLSHIGGSGYQNGGDATRTFVNFSANGQAGGGGGSTSVVANGTTYVVGGGAGAGFSFTFTPPGTPDQASYGLFQAGNGGGPNGGVAETATYGSAGQMKYFPGGDAPGGGASVNSGDGYVLIYAGYNPEYEQ